MSEGLRIYNLLPTLAGPVERWAEALPRIAGNLTRALAGEYPGVCPPAGWLTLASWVGGDRDGNPTVTAAVTAETLRLHRGLAVERHRRALHDLARRLSLSARRLPPPEDLRLWLEARRPRGQAVVGQVVDWRGQRHRRRVDVLARRQRGGDRAPPGRRGGVGDAAVRRGLAPIHL